MTIFCNQALFEKHSWQLTCSLNDDIFFVLWWYIQNVFGEKQLRNIIWSDSIQDWFDIISIQQNRIFLVTDKFIMRIEVNSPIPDAVN